jgi:hypothetical protein
MQQAAAEFSASFGRWRVMVDATRKQMDMADHVVKSYTTTHTEKQNAQRRYGDAARQYAVLLKSGNTQTPISTPTAISPAKASCRATTSRACRSWPGFLREVARR